MTTQHSFLWKDGQPYSTLYEDVYFSRDSGLEETRHVFLAHNHLSTRWQGLKRNHFTICETGFGTGLNFLCAWQLWNEVAPANAALHFVSTEKYPLQHDELARALSLWPELASVSHQLLGQYRLLAPGWHKLIFEQGRVTLTLLIGDARDTLPQLKACVDAWFLDGFAPAKNPEMWQQDLFDAMAKLSHHETTFATFTSAGIVRRGLQAAGFEVHKVAGFGSKREMLAGRFDTVKQTQPSAHQKAIVIGGGIAGTSSAHALAIRGWQVTLIERHAELAQEASGNPVAVLYPRLTGQDIVLGRLAQHGFLFTYRMLQRLELEADEYAACGLLQLAFDAREAARCKAVAARGLPEDLVRFVEAEEVNQIAGVALNQAGLFLPAAGWINPGVLCKKLAHHPNIDMMVSASALRLEQGDQQWLVWNEDTLLAQAPVVVIASANETSSFMQSAHLPIEPVRGQITCVPATEKSQKLKTVVCTDGYISPAVQGMHCIGATFSNNDTDLDIRERDHLDNLAMLEQLSPDLHESLIGEPQQGRVALRAVTPDYLPMAGPLLDAGIINNNPPRYNVDPATLPWLDGLYVNTGHGSKGLINAPLCAEMLASAINGEPAPVDDRLLAALDPNRFLLRKLGLKRLAQGLAAFPYSKITR
ncbi:MAG TPA: bifunctional tRNA (5-methylaminomethyl-2-thiouridine)(34)-methyltransferase MnmD/FAD-dependent 5-carboxymethylaminomethyl-2-thiouridine(34) oxidoreductase MnmC [Methylophilaceae bacterium]|nr:bifunctional tRNA (5-methylaminomethyl-2-thiouridine)(34)-methyltransferase MnmD/FAD-dependent 5-carboxymethylaminomethyl-2-thiouridine(34) oxidoreductase MnmC [Methylophilaceae bacterium]